MPHVNILFKDTGPGIDPDQIDRIFEVYYTSKSTGTGLGLPIAQQIVEKHNGRITVESIPERGTNVILSLPLLKTNEQEV